MSIAKVFRATVPSVARFAAPETSCGVSTLLRHQSVPAAHSSRVSIGSYTPSVSRAFHAAPARQLQKNAAQNSKSTGWVEKGNIKYEELKPITESPSGNVTIIDVREPSETSQGMIPSAVNVPLSEFSTAFKTGSGGGDFSKKYAFSRPGYDDQLVFYCRSGKRSAQAIEEAKKGGWWNVRNYEGSWLDWTAQEKARGQGEE